MQDECRAPRLLAPLASGITRLHQEALEHALTRGRARKPSTMHWPGEMLSEPWSRAGEATPGRSTITLPYNTERRDAVRARRYVVRPTLGLDAVRPSTDGVKAQPWEDAGRSPWDGADANNTHYWPTMGNACLLLTMPCDAQLPTTAWTWEMVTAGHPLSRIGF